MIVSKSDCNISTNKSDHPIQTPSTVTNTRDNIIINIIIDGLGPLDCFHSGLIRYYGFKRQLVGLLARGISTLLDRYIHRGTQTEKKRGHTYILE
jgi:hypothetical protein